MDTILHLLTRLYASLRPFAPSFLMFALMFTLIVLLEARSHANLGRYRQRGFWSDVIYAVFYTSGIYLLLLYLPIMALFSPTARLDLLPRLPVPVAMALSFLVVDCANYWMHRLEHASPVLWAFHSVHHSQQTLTSLTQFRHHVVNQLLHQVVMMIPIMALLGLPVGMWLPVTMLFTMLESLQHAELAWTYGPLGRLFVSPVFHSVHHSTDPSKFGRNFGMTLSIWDYLFGTADDVRVRERTAGLSDWTVTESPFAHFTAPFRALVRRKR